jgi:hypothetical protein
MIMVMSDTGSTSLVATHTDWPSERQCREVLVSHYTPPPPTEFNGHMATAKISASCVPVVGAQASLANEGGPPPVDCRYLIGGRVPQPGCMPPGISNPNVR